MKILKILCLLFITSCSSYLKTSATKMISPESNGKSLGGTIDIRVQQGQNAKLNFDDSTHERISREEELPSLNLYADLGIIDSLDFYVIQGSMLAPSMFGLKYQLLGPSRIMAKKGDSSLSIAAAFGSRNADKSIGDEDDDILDGNIRDLDLTHKATDVGLIYGYRWTDSFLHYFNFFYIAQEAKGNVTNKSGTLVDADFKFTGDSYLISTGAMWYVAPWFHFKLDLSHLKTVWSRGTGQTSNVINGGLGFNW